MARKARPTVFDVVDDYDGKTVLPEDVEATTFTIGGTRYRMDLTPAHAKKLEAAREVVQGFIDKAEKLGGNTSTARKRASRGQAKSGEPSLRQRQLEWGKANGVKVPERGAIHDADVAAKLKEAGLDK